MPDLKTEEMVINMGPQHPATHGVLRLEITTDGEIVKKNRASYRVSSSLF